jgi:hypothetical protein
MASLRTAAFALALLGSTMMIGQASAAMPVNGLTPAKAQIADNIQEARWWGPGWRYGRWGYGYRRWGYHPWGWGYRRWAWGYGPGWRGCGWHRCWW